jgi:hypothetical protein
MNSITPRRQLIRLLQKAYSGELAAAYAYRGHWKSLRDEAERERVRQIEDEEWMHRDQLGLMLGRLDAGPARVREVMMWTVGRTVSVLCHLIGWFLPMYFAGRLESGNVGEYETAALRAGRLGLDGFEYQLSEMARVEREHEVFFMRAVAGHRLLPLMEHIFGRVETDENGEAAPCGAAKPTPLS